METALCPVTVLIHTLNEEKNLPFALDSVVGWADQIIVIDSESTDGTQDVARAAGVEVYSRQCTRKTLVEQRNWALESLPIRNEWVFILDGDEETEPGIRDEVATIVRANPADKDGFWCRFRVIWNGRWIRRSSMYPTWTLRLFRRGIVRYERREVNAHPVVAPGREGYLREHIRTEDRRPFEYWVHRMNEFSTLESIAYAKVLSGESAASAIRGRLFGSHAERRRFLKNIFVRMPFRPATIFLYLYGVRLGFLDGRAGLDFALYKAGSEWMLNVKARERLRTTHSSLPSA
jgi:glycosyltransferase involved in cell wall biosynthesis